MDAGQLLDFVDSGRDLLLAVDSRASDEMRRARCQAVCFAVHHDRPASRSPTRGPFLRRFAKTRAG